MTPPAMTPPAKTLPALALSHLSALDTPPDLLAPLAAKAGFAAIGLRLNPAAPGGISYPLRAGTDKVRTLQRALADSGIGIHDVELIPLTPGLAIADFEPMLEAAAALGARRLNVTGDDPDLDRLGDHFAAVCAFAARFGLGVDLEFMRWRPVGTLVQARHVVERAGAAGGGILLDFLHIFRAGGAVADVANLPKGLITGAQVCDAPLAAPPDDRIIEEARTRRLPPGSGALPIIALLRALPADVPLSVEVPQSPGSSDPVATHLATLHQSTMRTLAAAGRV